MTYRLTATVSHKSFGKPITHEFFYNGNTKDDVLDQIKTLPQHIENLRAHSKTAFKDVNGVKHIWRLDLMPHLN